MDINWIHVPGALMSMHSNQVGPTTLEHKGIKPCKSSRRYECRLN